MADNKPPGRQTNGADFVHQMVRYARQKYTDSNLHMERIEDLYTGEVGTDSLVEDLGMKVWASGKPRIILRRLLNMLAVGSNMSIKGIVYSRDMREHKQVDRLEKLCHAYIRQQERARGSSPTYDVTFYALLRGRGAYHVVYNPLKEGVGRITTRVLDPLEYWPERSDHGYEWFVREYWKPKLELATYFDHLEPKRLKYDLPDLGDVDDPAQIGISSQVKVLEYWNERYCAYLVDNHYIGPIEHDYGFVPLAEARINQTPLSHQRWAYDGKLGQVANELEQYNYLVNMQLAAAPLYYWGYKFIINDDGALVQIDPSSPMQFTNLPADTRVIEFNPSPNPDPLLQAKAEVENTIQRATLPDPLVDPGVTDGKPGFGIAQMTDMIKEALEDDQRPLERATGTWLGQVMRLFEQFADAQEDGGWTLPLDYERGRKLKDKVTESDIDGHWEFEVRLKTDTPTARLQKITAMNQLRAPGPDGLPLFPLEEAMLLSGVDEMIEDRSEFQRRRQLEMLKMSDQYQPLFMEYAVAMNAEELEMMEREALRAKRRMEKRRQRREEREQRREIEEMHQEVLELTPEQWQDAGLLHRMAALVEQGIPPKTALEDELPFGVPGEMGQQAPPAPGGAPDPKQQQIDEILKAFQGGGGTPAPASPFQGFENGIAPTQLPAAMQGGLPRPQLDAANVQVEQAQQQARRGALPPPK